MSEELKTSEPPSRAETVHTFETEESGVDPALGERLEELLTSETEDVVRDFVSEIHHADLADLIGLISAPHRRRLLRILHEDFDPDLLLDLDDNLRLELVDILSAKEMAEALSELESDEAVQVLEDLPEADQVNVLREISADDGA